MISRYMKINNLPGCLCIIFSFCFSGCGTTKNVDPVQQPKADEKTPVCVSEEKPEAEANEPLSPDLSFLLPAPEFQKENKSVGESESESESVDISDDSKDKSKNKIEGTTPASYNEEKLTPDVYENTRLTATGNKKWDTRNVFAKINEEICIFFPESGWVLLNSGDWGRGLRFKSKERKKNSVNFNFVALKEGKYTLKFQKNNIRNATTAYEKVFVTVLRGEDFIPDSRDIIRKGDFSIADDLYEKGKLKEALYEYLMAYKKGNPDVDNRIGDIYFRLNDFDNAVKYWKKNLNNRKAALRDQAVKGIIKAAINNNDVELLNRTIDRLLKIRSKDAKEIILEAAAFLKDFNKIDRAASLYSKYIKLFPDDLLIDQIYYLLGRIYEMDSVVMDFKKSVMYYTIVIENFPSSLYWDKSKNRINYIKRHYLQIR